jgi:hypothetical protein
MLQKGRKKDRKKKRGSSRSWNQKPAKSKK